jgi:hypothetical protein
VAVAQSTAPRSALRSALVWLFEPPPPGTGVLARGRLRQCLLLSAVLTPLLIAFGLDVRLVIGAAMAASAISELASWVLTSRLGMPTMSGVVYGLNRHSARYSDARRVASTAAHAFRQAGIYARVRQPALKGLGAGPSRIDGDVWLAVKLARAPTVGTGSGQSSALHQLVQKVLVARRLIDSEPRGRRSVKRDPFAIRFHVEVELPDQRQLALTLPPGLSARARNQLMDRLATLLASAGGQLTIVWDPDTDQWIGRS